MRDLFVYCELGIAAATGGKVAAQLVMAHNAQEKGTGWHLHEVDLHSVIMLSGWARFMHKNQETLVDAGDCLHQRPGVRHDLVDCSPDMEYLEMAGPADFNTVDSEPACKVSMAKRRGA